MMQKKIIDQKIKELEIQEFVEKNLTGVGLSTTSLQVTPMAEKIIIHTSRPGLVVGRKGQSIKKMTGLLKKKFNLENPQIEINEVTNVNTDPAIIAERIANTLERFGINRFKGIGHKSMEDAMNAGALGIEILISGKVPSQRAKRWRFYQGYLKKCGDIAVTGVKTAYKTAFLKTGAIGIQVRIMPADIKLPDKVKFKTKEEEVAKAEAPAEAAVIVTETIEATADDSSESSKDIEKKEKKPRASKAKSSEGKPEEKAQRKKPAKAAVE
jgi:small subunit ribosomal protein S3